MKVSGDPVTQAGLDRKLPEVQRLQDSQACLLHVLSSVLFNTGRDVCESDHLHRASGEAFHDQQLKGKLAEGTHTGSFSLYPSVCPLPRVPERNSLNLNVPVLARSAVSPDPFTWQEHQA